MYSFPLHAVAGKPNCGERLQKKKYFNRCVDVEFLFLCVHCGLWSLQFEKHNSDLDKTKQKLVEAANLVDKVTSDLKPEKKKKKTPDTGV